MIELYEPELPLSPALPRAQDTWAQKFAAYDAANPGVLALFEKCAFARIRAGSRYLSPRDLFSDMRDIEGKCPNNNYSRFYADEFKAAYPEYEHLFRGHRRPEGKMAMHYTR